MFNLAGEELFTLGNVTMLRADALKNKNHLNPAVLAAVTAQLDAAPGRRFKLVANLPFHVATPLLSNLLALDRPPETMTCTIQKELAERIVARPRNQGLRRVGHLGAKPVPLPDSPRAAPLGVLAAAQGLLRLRPDRD